MCLNRLNQVLVSVDKTRVALFLVCPTHKTELYSVFLHFLVPSCCFLFAYAYGARFFISMPPRGKSNPPGTPEKQEPCQFTWLLLPWTEATVVSLSWWPGKTSLAKLAQTWRTHTPNWRPCWPQHARFAGALRSGYLWLYGISREWLRLL